MVPRLVVLASVTVLFFAACSSQDSTSSPVTQVQPCTNTVRLGALQDKSASTTPNGVYQLRADDLRPTAEPIIRCGGELALGIVGDLLLFDARTAERPRWCSHCLGAQQRS
jgi:hypothetical protein